MFLRKNPTKKKLFGGECLFTGRERAIVFVTVESCEPAPCSELSVSVEVASQVEEHVLVKFHDDKVSVVPRRYIKESSITVGGPCTVTCPGRPRYQAEILFLGRYHYIFCSIVNLRY